MCTSLSQVGSGKDRDFTQSDHPPDEMSFLYGFEAAIFTK
jgi:hypothetical protein